MTKSKPIYLPKAPPSTATTWIAEVRLQHMNLCMCVHAQWCPTLCGPVDHSLLGSSVHGIFQARTLVWIAIFHSRGSSQPRDRTQVSVSWVSCIRSRFFTTESPGKPMNLWGWHKHVAHKRSRSKPFCWVRNLKVNGTVVRRDMTFQLSLSLFCISNSV